MTEAAMTKTAKPRETFQPSKSIAQKQPGAELSEQELQKVSGGKQVCATGQHIKTGTITT
jgi:bacteriocin-like protein